MQIEFVNRQLARDCEDDRSRKKAFGLERAKKIRRRLSELQAAHCLEDLRNAPGRFHELKADRGDQLAADLDGPFRLIFEPVMSDEERPYHAGGLVWSRIVWVRILAIEDYHG